MDAVIVCIGDELLSGDVDDLNSTWLARGLTGMGTAVARIEIIPDDVDVIARTIQGIEAGRIVVTGGLGPTHDDVTRQAVARAFGRGLARDPEAVKVVEASAARRGRSPLPASYAMADIPENSRVIPNPVGAAPGFVVDGRAYVFPGVPSEMRAMFELVREEFRGPGILVDWLETAKPESALVGDLNRAVALFPEVKFGSYPSGVVRIKMKSCDAARLRAAKEWLSERIL